VRLVGLNTALLAADDHDQGKLLLGTAQRSALVNPPLDCDELAIVLSHHPFAAGWLADEGKVAPLAGKHATIHLSGHLHAPDAHQVVRADGSGIVCVSAGAAHVGSLAPGIPASHGYNIGAIVSSGRGLKLRIWPRRWSEKNGGFVIDAENVGNGKTFAEHNLSRFADFVPKSLGAKEASASKRDSPLQLVAEKEDAEIDKGGALNGQATRGTEGAKTTSPARFVALLAVVAAVVATLAFAGPRLWGAMPSMPRIDRTPQEAIASPAPTPPAVAVGETAVIPSPPPIAPTQPTTALPSQPSPPIVPPKPSRPPPKPRPQAPTGPAMPAEIGQAPHPAKQASGSQDNGEFPVAAEEGLGASAGQIPVRRVKGLGGTAGQIPVRKVRGLGVGAGEIPARNVKGLGPVNPPAPSANAKGP
jgi:hypothetical protein